MWFASCALLMAGCPEPEPGYGGGDDDTGDDDAADDDAADDDDTGDDDTGDDDTGDDDVEDDDTGDDDTAPIGASMYAHTSSVLYEVDEAAPHSLTLVGTFTGGQAGAQFTDLAMDPNGTMYAISFTDLYEVDPFTAQVSWLMAVGTGGANALTALDDGTLLAGDGNTIYELDPVGLTSSVYGTISGWVFSGDMVGLPDGLLYCLMGTDAMGETSLIVYDPNNGQVTVAGSTGSGAMYGVGFANWTIFGFNDSGQILSVDSATGAAAVVASPGNSFWGAATNPTHWD